MQAGGVELLLPICIGGGILGAEPREEQPSTDLKNRTVRHRLLVRARWSALHFPTDRLRTFSGLDGKATPCTRTPSLPVLGRRRARKDRLAPLFNVR